MSDKIQTKPIIGVTMGDPAGVGAEVALKALLEEDIRKICRPVIIGDAPFLQRIRDSLDIPARLDVVGAPAEMAPRPEPGVVTVLDLDNVPAGLPLGEAAAAGGRAAAQFIEKAVELAVGEEIAAIATAPINKFALKLAEVPFPGHTEMLAALTNTKHYAMMLVGPTFRVAHVTTHISMRQACDRIRTERVLRVIRLADAAVKKEGIERPRIAVAGLNPHAGEEGLFGDEDRDQIKPAVKAAQAEGFDASGPWPADTVFWHAHHGKFDVVIAMYHDQGHIPIKLLGIEDSVNVTIGLPIIRASVDHGTAYDIAGKGVADHNSMCAAIRVATRYATGGAV